ncbi:MAG: hypothetical protein ABIC95_01755 [archaeon]
MFGAMAADLSDYPKPMFIGEDGAFNGIVVVGNDAKAEDIIGATNIMASLQRAAVKTEVVSSANTIEVQGDAYKIEQSTNKLELSENLRHTGITSITSTNLEALKSGSVRNEFGTFTYTQYIELPMGANVSWMKSQSEPDEDLDIPKDYLVFNQSPAYTYKLSFTPALKSDNDANDRLEDLENKKIKMLGKEYTVVRADHQGVYNIKLTLMGGAVEDTMEEYTTKTYTIGGKEYKVEVVAITTLQVKFRVNGEITDPLAAGETYVLDDGSEIGIRDLLENEGTEEGGSDIVTFYLGAKKIVLTDTATNVTGGDGTVQVGSDTLANVVVDITSSSDGGIADGNDVMISGIEVSYTPGSMLYIPSGKGLSEVADLVEGDDGNVFASGFDIVYKGLQETNTEAIELRPSGSNNYKLKFVTKAGVEYNQAVFGNSGGTPFLGERSGSNDRDMITAPATPVNDEEFVIIGDGTDTGYARILQFKSVQNADDLYRLKDVGTGDIYDVSYDSGGTGTLVVDGFSTTIVGDGDDAAYLNFSRAQAYIPTQFGAKIEFINATLLAVSSETAEDGATRNNITVGIEYDTTNTQLNLDTQSFVGIGSYTDYKLADDDEYEGMVAPYGVKWKFFDSTGSGQDKFIITYPDDQTTAAVFVTSEVTGTSTSGGVTRTTFVPIPISASKLASEVSNVENENAIVVGGPCVNSAAALLMGNPAECWAGFEEGKAMLKVFENDGNVALLVAGFGAVDTKRATNVLAEWDKYDLSGSELVVSETATNDIKVSKPEPMSDE